MQNNYRRGSTISEADSETVQIKEEFERKEKDYRGRIHTLKKEVTLAKESLNKIELEQHTSKERSNTSMNQYAFLDSETLRKVNLKDVKISLLKERIEKAKIKQIEI